MASRSWISVVRKSIAAGSTLNSNAAEWHPAQPQQQKPRVVFHAFCVDCGAEAEVCANGCDRPAIDTWKKRRICGGCYYDAMWRLGSDSMSIGIIRDAERENDPKFKCRRCAN